MRTLFASLVAVTGLLLAAPAYPCGAPFGSGITVDPHQDIIIAWKDGVQTYAFQPTFCGNATDFGLILPIPAKLAQTPTVIDAQAFAKSAALSEPNKREVVDHNNVGCGGSSSAGASKSASDEPTVVANGRVGMLDWSELKAENEASFTKWLDANGYPYSPAASAVFAYYVEKGWYFLAFRISQEAAPAGSTICRSLGPVALTFPSPAPVIPSRMASADNPTSGARVSWRIFGITSGDVQLTFAQADHYQKILWYSGALGEADAAAMAGLAQPGDRLTRLTMAFSKSESADVALKLDQAQDYRGTEDIVIHDDSACSLDPRQRSGPGALLGLCGLALLASLLRRRVR